jgi:chromosome partitioning protein
MVCVFAQQKGGVGKTTSAINAGVLLAQAGRRVLAVDVDPQFALTRRLGIDPGALETTVVDVLAGWVDARSAIVAGVHGLDVLPASRELAGVELALAGEVNRETVLHDALDGLGYDLVVVDTPSNLGLLTVNALVAADVVVAPVAADDDGAAQGGRGASRDDRQAQSDPTPSAGAGCGRHQSQAAAGDERRHRRRDRVARPAGGRPHS